jgi:hypothetical protein
VDTVEVLPKTVDVFDKSILGDKAHLIFQNVHCKERMRKLCVLWDRIHLSRLVLLTHAVRQMDGQTWPALYVLFSCTYYKECINRPEKYNLPGIHRFHTHSLLHALKSNTCS